jgi:hypothetical protein
VSEAFAAFLMNAIAASWEHCDVIVRTEMLWVISCASQPLADRWEEVVLSLHLDVLIESGLVSINKQLATAAVTCFTKVIEVVTPRETHLRALLDLLATEHFTKVASSGILEVLRLYPDTSRFFLGHGILERAFFAFAKHEFSAKNDVLLVLCALANGANASSVGVLLEKAVIELFLEYLETAPSPSTTFHICRALLAMATAADATGNREAFVSRFQGADGENVMANLHAAPRTNQTVLMLIRHLYVWYHPGEQEWK